MVKASILAGRVEGSILVCSSDLLLLVLLPLASGLRFWVDTDPFGSPFASIRDGCDASVLLARLEGVISADSEMTSE